MVAYTNLSDRISFLDILPISHIAGFSTAISCFLIGAEQGLLPKVSAEYLSRGFLEYNPTNFIMISKVYEIIQEKILAAIRKRPVINTYYRGATELSRFVRRHTGIRLTPLFRPIISAAMGKNMVICGCGTAQCPESLAEFYLNLGIDFANVYGSTETGFPVTAANCKTDAYPAQGVGSIHQFPDIKIEITHPDETGRGEILVKTSLIMKGYFNDPELTKNAFDARGYFRTGDLGYVDGDGRLHITGRAKEAILLKNGNKAAPDDIDRYYQPLCPPGCLVASCGVPVSKSGYEEIHLFIESVWLSDGEREKLRKTLLEHSKRAGSIYKIKEIHFVDSIPTTSIGKIKRFQLRNMVVLKKDEKPQPTRSEKTVLADILDTIKEYGHLALLRPNDSLKEDLGLDSLTLMEICAKLEDIYGTFIGEHLAQLKTAEDIAAYIETGALKDSLGGKGKYFVEDFPLKRKLIHRTVFRLMMFLLHSLYKLQVEGVENIPLQGSYILCPNHQSHLDSMCVWSSLRDRRPPMEKIACMAADYLLENPITRLGLIVMGGIPVARTGNAIPATHRIQQCLREMEYCFLIYPEGTRTRNGNMGQFKAGAAQIAIDANIPIIPVRIEGGYDIFPASRPLPRLFDWKHFRRYRLKISFAEPVYPDQKTAQEMMDEVERAVKHM